MLNEVEKYYNLNDPNKKGPRGFVFAYDSNGELLFTQENMIVLTGRRALANYGFDSTNSFITHAILSNELAPTTPDMNSIISPSTNDINYIILDRNQELESTENIKNATISDITGEIIIDENSTEITESCFVIDKSNISTNKPYALCKIFFANSPQEIKNEKTTKTGGYFTANNITNKYSCIRLYIGDINKNGLTQEEIFQDSVLFSRVVFPEYTKTIRNFMIFNYYIYF